MIEQEILKLRAKSGGLHLPKMGSYHLGSGGQINGGRNGQNGQQNEIGGKIEEKVPNTPKGCLFKTCKNDKNDLSHRTHNCPVYVLPLRKDLLQVAVIDEICTKCLAVNVGDEPEHRRSCYGQIKNHYNGKSKDVLCKNGCKINYLLCICRYEDYNEGEIEDSSEGEIEDSSEGENEDSHYNQLTVGISSNQYNSSMGDGYGNPAGTPFIPEYCPEEFQDGYEGGKILFLVL